MAIADRDTVPREAIHKAVDELPDERLVELAEFIGYLRYKEQHDMDWFYHLQDLFASVRDAAEQISEEKVNEVIDDAIAAVRGERKT